MDPLLRSCNLHAEGPRTLRLLERRGVRTSAALLALPVERLAELLGGSPAAARRFRREVALASNDGLQREPEESARAESNTADFTPRVRIGTELRAPPPALDIDVTERPRPSLAAPTSRHAWPDNTAAAARDVRAAPSPTPPPPTPVRAPAAGDLLRPGLLAGLDVRTCECLVAEGVRTLAQLASAPPERLATLAGLPLALVTGLCADAARYTAKGTPRPAAREVARPVAHVAHDRTDRGASSPAERIVEWTPAPRRGLPVLPGAPALVDVAGPFAGDVELLAAKAWLSARES